MAVPAADNLQFEYLCDEIDPTATADDNSCNGNDGTVVGTPDWDQTHRVNSHGSWYTGADKDGQCIQTSGVGDYETTDAFAYEAFIYKTQDVSQNWTVFSKYGAAAPGYIGYHWAAGVLFGLYGAGGTARAQKTSLFQLNGYHHLVYAWDADAGDVTDIHIIYNGVDQTLAALNDTLSGTLKNASTFQTNGNNGLNNGGSWWMTHNRLWNQTITEAEAVSLYNSGNGYIYGCDTGSDDHIKRYYYR